MVTAEEFLKSTPQSAEEFLSVEQPAPVSEMPGLMTRINENLGRRGANIGEALSRMSSLVGSIEEQGVPETAFQVGGQALGAVGDVLGDLAISGYRALPDVPYGATEVAQDALGLLGRLPSAGGGTLGEGLPQEIAELTRLYSDFSEENPRSAANIEAALNIGTAFVPVKAPAAVKAVTSAPRKLGKTIRTNIPSAEDVTSETLREAASSAYKTADDLGGIIKANKTAELADNIGAKIAEEGATLPAATRIAVRGVADPENVVRQASDIFETLRGQDLTLDGFKTIDQTLGDLAYKPSTPDDVSRKVLIMQRELRDLVENASPSDFVNGEAFDAYKNARGLWSKQAKIRDLENITSRAFATDNPSSSLKRALKRYLANPNNRKGFAPDEIGLIEDAAKSGIATELLKNISGRLSSRVALGTGDLALAPALTAASAGARTFSDDLALRQMQKINQLIANEGLPQRTLFGSIGEPAGNALGSLSDLIENTYGGARGRLGTLSATQAALSENERRQ